MTIEKGVEWGRTVVRPPGLRIVDGDRALVDALTDGTETPVAPGGGDLHRTLGQRDSHRASEFREVSIDLLRVTLDDTRVVRACAHVLLQRPWWRGGWWLGDVVMIMNAEFVGDWHVVARGHPNDGRAESCEWHADFGVRDRLEARRRLPTNGHVPHPKIDTRSFRDRVWSFDRPMLVTIDGVQSEPARTVQVTVEADAATILS